MSTTVDLYSLPGELLATYGTLGRDGARRLHQFACNNFLDSLGFLKTGGDTTGSDVITVNDSSSTEEKTATEVARRAVKVSSGMVDSEVTVCEGERGRLSQERYNVSRRVRKFEIKGLGLREREMIDKTNTRQGKAVGTQG